MLVGPLNSDSIGTVKRRNPKVGRYKLEAYFVELKKNNNKHNNKKMRGIHGISSISCFQPDNIKHITGKYLLFIDTFND